MTHLEATLKVILDGQAYLWALYNMHGKTNYLGNTEFQELEDAWKAETVKLIEELTDGN